MTEETLKAGLARIDAEEKAYNAFADSPLRRIRLTEKEIHLLYIHLHHYTDYLSGDDRPDHGWNKLKREDTSPILRSFYRRLCGKLGRLSGCNK